MDARLAPYNAAQLMWHADTNWSNPLWWLRAARSHMHRLIAKGKDRRQDSCAPGILWIILSSTMFVLFAAIPLSGLTIQTVLAQTKSNIQATIFGPDRTHLGAQAIGNQNQIDYAFNIRSSWQSGRVTTPPSRSLFYAPSGVGNVNETYFDDQLSRYAVSIETFTGPAVEDVVVGNVWGLWANLSCQPVPPNELKLIKIEDLSDYYVNLCQTSSVSSCNFTWMAPQLANETVWAERSLIDSARIILPTWLDESMMDYGTMIDYSMIAAADGHYITGRSPYFVDGNHDVVTLDHFRGRPTQDITTGAFEIFLWQSRYKDPAMDAFNNDSSGLILINYFPSGQLIDGFGYADVSTMSAGFGVHCDVSSAVGTASINPATRQFSDFVQQPAIENTTINSTVTSSPSLYPIQIQAMTSFAADYGGILDSQHLMLVPRDFRFDTAYNGISQSINARTINITDTTAIHVSRFPLLQPRDLQKSMYKLLGESMIALMSQGAQNDPSTGDLYLLRTSTYLVAGPIPWQYVMALLSIWALVTSLGALWMLLANRPRWAPTLNGFELFKFGAQYADNINDCTDVDFRHCNGALQNIPGAVGLLPGTGAVDVATEGSRRKPYFIGLSEIPVGSELCTKKTEFTFDIREAARTRSL